MPIIAAGVEGGPAGRLPSGATVANAGRFLVDHEVARAVLAEDCHYLFTAE